jgi:predicted Zn-dependent peptidase
MNKPQLTVLNSGLKVLQVPMPSVKSATVLALVSVGSRYEEKNQYGIAHFFEHMVFKGTELYPTAQDLAMAVDSVGASFNAYTSREYTGYYVHASSDHVDLSLSVVSEMLLTPKLRQEDIDREKGVIIEEINMYVDSPASYINNKFDQMVFANSGLEHDILGLKESVLGMTREDFISFLSQWYALDNITIVVSGDERVVSDPAMIQKIELAFSKTAVGNRVAGANPINKEQASILEPSKRLHIESRKTEQSHFILGWPALKRKDSKKYALGLLNTVLGASMSSRLFSEVREKRGLCYYVSSTVDQYHDRGIFGASAGVDPKRVDEAIKVTIDQFYQVAQAKNPVTAQELEMAKQYITGKIVLSLENTQAVAQFFGMRMMLENKVTTAQALIEKFHQVSLDQVNELAQTIIQPKTVSFAIIGEYDSQKDVSRFEKNIK